MIPAFTLDPSSFVGLTYVIVLGILCISTQRAARTIQRLEKTVDRMERATAAVATNLARTAPQLKLAASQRADLVIALDRMEHATEVVADNLADSVSRADATVGPDGAAADAALRTGDTAEAIHERQGSHQEP